MLRIIKRSFLFIPIILILTIQSAGAVSFKNKYKISANNQYLGTLSRTTSSEGYIAFDLNILPLDDDNVFNESQAFIPPLQQEKVPSLNEVLIHLQSLLSNLAPGSTSAAANNTISMILMEKTDHSSSITYSFLGKTCCFSESAPSEDFNVTIHGQSGYYNSTSIEGLQFKPFSKPDISDDEDEDEDEGISEISTISDKHPESLFELVNSSLVDNYGDRIQGHYFIFGRDFEQLLTALIEGKETRKDLFELHSIFPVFTMIPEQEHYEITSIAYTQELIYSSACHIVTQQDAADDPYPCGLVITYHLNSDNVVKMIVFTEGTDKVEFIASE